MRTTLACLAMALLAPSFPALAQSRPRAVVPASPVALELVHLDVDLNVCNDVRGIELIEGGLRILVVNDDRNTYICDSGSTQRIALGAFAPGSYRVEVRETFMSGAPPSVGGVIQFVVRPAPASTIPNDDRPIEDLSGVWTSPTQPSTGLFLVHSLGAMSPTPAGDRPSELLTGFWAVFDAAGAPTWYLLVMEQGFSSGAFLGTVVRYSATGTGMSRMVTPSTVGTIRIEAFPSHKRVRGNIGDQEFDFDIEPLRWTRAAWPGAAPPQIDD